MMRRILAAAFLLASSAPSFAQQGGGVVVFPPITAGHCASWKSLNVLQDAGGACTTGGSGFPITLGSTSVAAGSTTTTINGLAVGTTTPAAGAFTTLSSTGTYTPSQTSGIVGTTTNNNANAGSWGEYQESIVLVGAAVPLTSGGTFNITSLAVGAGDWDCNGVATTTNGVGTATALSGYIVSLVSVTGTSGSLGQMNYNNGVQQILNLTTAFPPFAFVGPMRFSFPGAATVYMTVAPNFSGGTLGGFGHLRCRRVR